MKVKAGEIRGIVEAIDKTANLKLPIKISYWLARTAKQLDPEFRAFEESRLKLIQAHAEKDDEGKVVPAGEGQVKIVDAEKFNEEYSEIADQEIEIKMDPIALDALGDIDIEPAVVHGLLPLLKED